MNEMKGRMKTKEFGIAAASPSALTTINTSADVPQITRFLKKTDTPQSFHGECFANLSETDDGHQGCFLP